MRAIDATRAVRGPTRVRPAFGCAWPYGTRRLAFVVESWRRELLGQPFGEP
jgi:hypothetical protein